MPSADQHFDRFVALAREIGDEYPAASDPWIHSPFAWIRSQPSSRKGKIIERLVAGWLKGEGLAVAPRRTKGSDLQVAEHAVEIKGSTLWKAGFYKFQQLRDQRYDFVICLGLSPSEVHCWAVPKPILMDAWRAQRGGIGGQHSGAGAKETAWLEVRPDSVPGWIAEWGGSAAAALDAVRRIIR